MRHQRRVRRLGRTTSHHRALLISLSTALFDKERIETTLPKAKQLRAYAEKLITKAKKGGLHNRRLIMRDIKDKDVVAKLMGTISARFADRPGGYTRILKTGHRKGDAADMAIIELVEANMTVVDSSEKVSKTDSGKKTSTKKTVRKKPKAKTATDENKVEEEKKISEKAEEIEAVASNAEEEKPEAEVEEASEKKEETKEVDADKEVTDGEDK